MGQVFPEWMPVPPPVPPSSFDELHPKENDEELFGLIYRAAKQFGELFKPRLRQDIEIPYGLDDADTLSKAFQFWLWRDITTNSGDDMTFEKLFGLQGQELKDKFPIKLKGKEIINAEERVKNILGFSIRPHDSTLPSEKYSENVQALQKKMKKYRQVGELLHEKWNDPEKWKTLAADSDYLQKLLGDNQQKLSGKNLNDKVGAIKNEWCDCYAGKGHGAQALRALGTIDDFFFDFGKDSNELGKKVTEKRFVFNLVMRKLQISNDHIYRRLQFELLGLEYVDENSISMDRTHKAIKMEAHKALMRELSRQLDDGSAYYPEDQKKRIWQTLVQSLLPDIVEFRHGNLPATMKELREANTLPVIPSATPSSETLAPQDWTSEVQFESGENLLEAIQRVLGRQPESSDKLKTAQNEELTFGDLQALEDTLRQSKFPIKMKQEGTKAKEKRIYDSDIVSRWGLAYDRDGDETKLPEGVWLRHRVEALFTSLEKGKFKIVGLEAARTAINKCARKLRELLTSEENADELQRIAVDELARTRTSQEELSTLIELLKSEESLACIDLLISTSEDPLSKYFELRKFEEELANFRNWPASLDKCDKEWEKESGLIKNDVKQRKLYVDKSRPKENHSHLGRGWKKIDDDSFLEKLMLEELQKHRLLLAALKEPNKQGIIRNRALWFGISEVAVDYALDQQDFVGFLRQKLEVEYVQEVGKKRKILAALEDKSLEVGALLIQAKEFGLTDTDNYQALDSMYDAAREGKSKPEQRGEFNQVIQQKVEALVKVEEAVRYTTTSQDLKEVLDDVSISRSGINVDAAKAVLKTREEAEAEFSEAQEVKILAALEDESRSLGDLLKPVNEFGLGDDDYYEALNAFESGDTKVERRKAFNQVIQQKVEERRIARD